MKPTEEDADVNHLNAPGTALAGTVREKIHEIDQTDQRDILQSEGLAFHPFCEVFQALKDGKLVGCT